MLLNLLDRLTDGKPSVIKIIASMWVAIAIGVSLMAGFAIPLALIAWLVVSLA